jgi:VIT1/CCC1 family predicted Fe2+/Mn2+ transporter
MLTLVLSIIVLVAAIGHLGFTIARIKYDKSR